MATLGDLDGDGLNEICLSSRQTATGSSFRVVYDFYSERDWESTAFSFDTGELEFLDVSTSSRGEASMLLSFQNWDSLHFLEHVDDGTCLLYTSPSPRDATLSRMPSSA